MPPHTRKDLLRDLSALGVETGDLLFVHSSYKSLGQVVGRAKTVVRALEHSISDKGLLLMPSFNLVDHEQRTQTWDPETTPSTVGWLTEYFRRQPGVFRSDHYSHSVSGRGKGAQSFLADHLSREGLESPWDREPWGKTYGLHSPMYRAYRVEGKLLMLGVDYSSSTYIHLVEVMHWHRRRAADPSAPHRYINRTTLGEFWDQTSDLRRGSVGDAECRLFPIRQYVDSLLAEVERQPELYLA